MFSNIQSSQWICFFGWIITKSLHVATGAQNMNKTSFHFIVRGVETRCRWLWWCVWARYCCGAKCTLSLEAISLVSWTDFFHLSQEKHWLNMSNWVRILMELLGFDNLYMAFSEGTRSKRAHTKKSRFMHTQDSL